MKKAATVAVIAFILMMTQVGSVFAETPLNKVIEDLKGTPYDYGGTTTDGFDCSGFTMYVFGKFGIELPHSSKAQAQKGSKVSKDELRPGDLVFFETGDNGISHVGIYVGDGLFAHSASKNKKGVTINRLNDSYYAERYVTARRILGDEAFKKLTTEPTAEASAK